MLLFTQQGLLISALIKFLHAKRKKVLGLIWLKINFDTYQNSLNVTGEYKYK